jgi:SMC interacting uncharacterized protein involved in chromosome segregation
MAEINKLSVSKVLDKLRSNDAKDNRSKLDRLDDEIKTADEEVQRLRAQRNRLKRGRRTGAIDGDGEL